MNWDLLLQLLEYFSISGKRNYHFTKADCIMLAEPDSEDRADTVYIADGTQPERHFSRALFIYTGKSPVISDNYIRVAKGSAAEVLNRLLKAQAHLHSLSEALTAAHSNQEVLDTAFSFTHVPYFYFDASYRILAIAGDVDPSADPEWKHMTEKGFLSPESIKLMQSSGHLDMLAEGDDPIPYHAGFFPFSSLVCNIRIDGQFYGRLNMLGTKGEPDEMNRQECRIICMHLLRISAAPGTRVSYSGPLSHMVRDLLQGLYLSEELIQDRLSLMPQLKNSLVQVCCIDPHVGNDPQVLPYYTSLIREYLSQENALTLEYDNRIVLLLHAPDEDGFVSFYEKLSSLLEKQELPCGISNIFSQFNQLRYYYLQALTVLSLHNRSQALTFFRDVYFPYLLSFLPREQASAMVSYDILRLWKLEPEYQFPLTATLRTYLESGCNLQKTAERLFIHKNTALYRINHIRQLLHCDLEDAGQQMQLWFSFQILDRYPLK